MLLKDALAVNEIMELNVKEHRAGLEKSME